MPVARKNLLLTYVRTNTAPQSHTSHGLGSIQHHGTGHFIWPAFVSTAAAAQNGTGFALHWPQPNERTAAMVATSPTVSPAAPAAVAEDPATRPPRIF